MEPIQLFRRGFDYVEIAIMLQTTEAEVEKRIHAARKDERSKRDGKARRNLIPYAGAEHVRRKSA